jgi:hypothetical protein
MDTHTHHQTGLGGRLPLQVLALLCREIVLQHAGISVTMRDAVPRLEVHGVGGAVVDVRLSDDGSEVVFRPSYARHSAADLPGAASAAVALIRACADEPGEDEATDGEHA